MSQEEKERVAYHEAGHALLPSLYRTPLLFIAFRSFRAPSARSVIRCSCPRRNDS